MIEMDELISFSKRRGFVYQNSEIYGGLAGVYDYGPYGAELAKNIKDLWWQKMVHENSDVVGIDSSIFMAPEVWEASGHVSGFSDPLLECKSCHTRLRADHMLEAIGIVADEKMGDDEINKLLSENSEKLQCTNCLSNNLTEAKSFNLLVQSNLGNFAHDWTDNPVYLRGETAQGIYINFKNVVDTTRVKVPFGIAQIGKAFRNEISARQFIFRKREFEQMEMQYFTHPDESSDFFELWKSKRFDFYTKTLGFSTDKLKFKEHENLVFYAKAATDIEYDFPSLGFKELEGIHARGDYDLSVHEKASGKDLSYTDPKTGEKYLPHVVETSVGLDRMLLASLSEFYDKDFIDGEERVVIRFPFDLAPVKVAVFPLLKNKPELTARAKEIFDQLKSGFASEYDESGSIGKRYRRQDEIGTPWCITVDFDTLEDNTVTLRNRDTTEQKRISVDKISEYIL